VGDGRGIEAEENRSGRALNSYEEDGEVRDKGSFG